MPQLRVAIGLALVLCLSGCGSSSQKKEAIDSLRLYVDNYLNSYNSTRHERISLTDDGWAKEYFEADLASAKLSVEPSDSETSPYVGKADFRVICHLTAFHHSREAALTDDAFRQTNVTVHSHAYVYQDGRWIPLDDKDDTKQ